MRNQVPTVVFSHNAAVPGIVRLLLVHSLD